MFVDKLQIVKNNIYKYYLIHILLTLFLLLFITLLTHTVIHIIMKALIQRVKYANVKVNTKLVGSIDNGLLVFLGIMNDDTEDDIKWLADKISKLRIFNDENGKMNLSLLDLSYDLLIVSQFTLFASTKKGNRPSFIQAAKPDIAIPLYDKSIAYFKSLGIRVEQGLFGGDMKVELLNDGPVTISIDTKNKE